MDTNLCVDSLTLSLGAWHVQVFHALFENIHVDYKYSPANQSARFAVYSVQIDNQLLSSTHPVVLCHSNSGKLLCSLQASSHSQV